MARGYFTTPISENIEETPEGFLIARDCVLGRTGTQTYSVKELPQEAAADMGVDVSNPHASIDLFRSPEEVFSRETLCSAEGKPVTESHPPDFVDPRNFSQYAKGHIQNIRRGTEPLDSGDWPIIGDVHITAEPLLSKVRNKIVREVSLGYDYSIKKIGNQIHQADIVVNHLAVVPKGRAGPEARIQDAAPELHANLGDAGTPPIQVFSEVPAAAPVAYPPIVVNMHKEKQPVAEKQKFSLTRLLWGKHLIEAARATDADPEAIMDLAKTAHDDVVMPENTQLNEFQSEDKKGKDGEVPPAFKEHEFKAEDRRKKMHDALDAMLNEEGMDRKKGKDADIDELKSLLDEYLDEEKDEPEHAADEVDPSELEATLTDSAECPDCGEAHDAEEECPGQKLVESGEEELVGDAAEDPDDDEDQVAEDRKRATDAIRAKSKAQARDGATAVLRMLRPVVARTGDRSVQAAFNRALDSVKKSSRPSTGSYGKFAASSRARDRAPQNPNPRERARAADGADPIQKMQAAYDAAFKGGK